jgi:hypothetical protein
MTKVVSLAKKASSLLYKQKEAELIELAEKYRGNFKLIADKADLTTAQVQRFYKDYEPFQNAVDEAKSAFYNSAVAILEQLIEQGNMSAINLYFARSPWAKKNGWGEKVETDSSVRLTDTEKAAKAKEILGL